MWIWGLIFEGNYHVTSCTWTSLAIHTRHYSCPEYIVNRVAVCAMNSNGSREREAADSLWPLFHKSYGIWATSSFVSTTSRNLQTAHSCVLLILGALLCPYILIGSTMKVAKYINFPSTCEVCRIPSRAECTPLSDVTGLTLMYTVCFQSKRLYISPCLPLKGRHSVSILSRNDNLHLPSKWSKGGVKNAFQTSLSAITGISRLC
jgi:hypothetical protein